MGLTHQRKNLISDCHQQHFDSVFRRATTLPDDRRS
ncbi:hypothetical protein D0263_03975 [Vibrio parahaemolyticus]|nr:hypothetical protein [Vibrio parahaemolyticus]EGQ9101619.1 hypothetical protein [Vibrio parahaemolyticus]EGQ9622175.1 hypothetical protein [Vibrio parahaemolyticus]EGR2346961.1 hypothetical protein [Vibrio parahaemolyticus]EGR2978225.1 hypothetical protein [Vibrio parahaemolyticus]